MSKKARERKEAGTIRASRDPGVPSLHVAMEVRGVKSSGDWPRFMRALHGGPYQEIEIDGLFHLLPMEDRIQLLLAGHRSLVVGGTMRITCPHWSHGRSYIDPLVQWPPVSAEFFYPLNAAARKQIAPHLEATYPVDFDFNVAGAWDTGDHYVSQRAQEVQAVMLHRNINCTVQLIVILTKRAQK